MLRKPIAIILSLVSSSHGRRLKRRRPRASSAGALEQFERRYALSGTPTW